MQAPLQVFNETLFLLLNAPLHPSAAAVLVAKFFAEVAIGVVPLALVAGWVRGGNATRKLMLEAAAAGLVGLLVAQVIGLVWPHPRPFMVGLGRTLIPHAADSSFPSDHLTLLWSITFSWLMHPGLRRAGAVLALLGVPMAWARIYLGVHFPADMAGAAIVAGLSAWLCARQQRWLGGPIFHYVNAVYRRLFGPLIRRGWVSP